MNYLCIAYTKRDICSHILYCEYVLCIRPEIKYLFCSVIH